MADDSKLISAGKITGPELKSLKEEYWPQMAGTRKRALEEREFLLGNDQAPLPETFNLAGADHFRASIPHSITVPQRVRQKVISRRPQLSIPLGPKGLGITAQRLTTKVEQPLNSIMEDRKAGFRWEDAADITLLEGFCASVRVVDPADWQKHPSAWDDDSKHGQGEQRPGTDGSQDRRWKKKYRLDQMGRDEGDDGYEQNDTRARKRYEDDLDWHRARNIPLRHKAVSIQNCAPIFGPDLSVEGLIIDEEYSQSRLKRMYHIGPSGLATPTGGTSDSTALANTSISNAMHLISYWAYDEDGIPYVSYCVQGANGEYQETRWKGGDADGELAIINLKDRFGLDRLPVSWRWGLGWNTANPDHRSLPFTRPFRPGWKTVNSMLTGIAVWVWWRGFPTLIEEVGEHAPQIADIEGEESPVEPQIIMPMQVLRVRGSIKEIMTAGPDAAVFKAIDIHLGSSESEAPGKSNKDQSGFSQSMAEGFEEMALTTVRQSLAELYEDDGSFILEAGKRMPELPKAKGSPGFAPIMVFRSTDVPTSDKAGSDSARNEPMELDPDLIDETFTTVARYKKEMSIPERQQSMEAVERRLKTRRQHLEDDGINDPETVELELIAEDQRALPEYQQYLLKLVAELQGAEELEEIAKGQEEGIMNDKGMPTYAGAGVMDPNMLPPGMMAPPQGALMPGTPQDGSVTGMGTGSMGTQALAGTVSGPGMVGPMNTATAAGGVLPPSMPIPPGA